MNDPNLIPITLLALFSATMAAGLTLVWLVLRWRRKHRAVPQAPVDCLLRADLDFIPPPAFRHRPTSWLAVRSRNLRAVQSALGLTNPQPCTWMEALAEGQKLFLAPPVDGWILLVGSRLPDPGDDVDVVFRFLLDLSRKLGRVQFFNADPVTGHHAWVWAEAGRIVRAYAWAGKTVWNQGIETRAELELGLRGFAYGEAPGRAPFGQPDCIASNTEAVPLLAARWSLDPGSIGETFEHTCGIAGEPARRF